MRWGVLLFALLLPAWAGGGGNGGCTRIKEALTPAPLDYVRIARVWVDGRYLEGVAHPEVGGDDQVRKVSPTGRPGSRW